MARLQAEQRQLLLEKKQYDEKRRQVTSAWTMTMARLKPTNKRPASMAECLSHSDCRRMVEEERRRIEQAERVRKEREEEERHKAEIKAQKEAKRRLEEERKREWEERRRAAARNKQAQEQDMWGAVLVPGGGVAQPRSTSPISARSRTPDRRERMTPERDRAARNQLAMHAHLQAREEALRNKQRHMEELYGRRDGPQWNPSMQEDSTRTVPQSQQSTVSVISQEERARLFR